MRANERTERMARRAIDPWLLLLLLLAVGLEEGTVRSPPAVGVPAREYVIGDGSSRGGSENWRVGVSRPLLCGGPMFAGLSRIPESSELNRPRASCEGSGTTNKALY